MGFYTVTSFTTSVTPTRMDIVVAPSTSMSPMPAASITAPTPTVAGDLNSAISTVAVDGLLVDNPAPTGPENFNVNSFSRSSRSQRDQQPLFAHHQMLE
jgi:hypothetical protein